MKNLVLTTSVLLLLISISCKEETTSGGDPITWDHYFVFVDSEGNDFLSKNNEYDQVLLKFSFGEFPFEDSLNIEKINLFGYGAWGSSVQYISFGNGDIDTLTREWKPATVQSLGSQFDDLDEITFYYNGKEVETWDFVENPELLYELKRRNQNSIAMPSATDPIYIKIVKEPDFDELN